MPRKIMVVDDDEGVRALLAAALGGAGYTVFPVAAAEEAQELVMRENIQVAFIDLQLPGMSGLELCRRIRSPGPRRGRPWRARAGTRTGG